MYDAAVIGAGPVGSRVALRLAESGHKVVVLEQKSRLDSPVCCTGIISQRCVRHFGIDETVILKKAKSARAFSPSGTLIELKRTETQAVIVDRPAFNLALARQAQEKGATYLLGSTVTNLEVGKDSVRVRTGDQKLEARVAVIASGSSSKLVEAAGFGKFSDFTMGAQAVVSVDGLKEVEIYLGRKIAPAFFAWLVPVSARKALVGLMARRRTGFYLKKLISSLTAQRKINSQETAISYSPIPLKPLTRTHAHRLIVVGSAAGQVKPTTGGGIYFGLLCADIAADSLHIALESDNLSARRLMDYEKDWRKRLGHELRMAYWSRKFFELLSDRRLDNIFDIVHSNRIAEDLLADDNLDFDFHSAVALKLLSHHALTRALAEIKLPLPSD